MAKIVDQRNYEQDFFTERLLEYFKSTIACHLPCKVIKYDKDKHLVNVQPLPLQSDGKKRAPINEVIVPYSVWKNDEMMEQIFKWKKFVQDQMKETVSEPDINAQHKAYAAFLKPILKEWKKDYKPLKVGSVVNVGFYDRDSDNFSGKANYNITSRRMHDLTDAYVEQVVFND